MLIFIITILLLAADFYYLKNIAGRRLVGLRWWNEVDAQSGDSHWVFESAPQPNEPGGKLVNATDRRFFWLALYCQPALWIALAIVAIVRFEFIWLTLVGGCGNKRKHGNGTLLTAASHRTGAYYHEHPRLLTVRQVQPGKWPCRQWSLLSFIGPQCRRSTSLTLLQ